MKTRRYAKTTLAMAVSFIFVLGFAPASVGVGTSGYSSSANVIVLNENGTPYGAGGAGYFPTSAASAYDLTYMAADEVTGVSSFGVNDTVVLWEYCSIGDDSTVQSALVSFLQNGGKVIIWDSDSCTGSSQADYSWLSAVGASFSVSTPGATGSSGGSVTVIENNDFLIDVSTSDLSYLVSSTDAVGDLNTVTTSSQSWCATLSGTNIAGDTGYASAYTGPGSLAGAPGGLLVYTGFDTDYISYGGGSVLTTLILNQLSHGWGNSAYTSDLHCSVHITTQQIAPTFHWPCQEGTCYTSFVAFNVTSGGNLINAAVTLSRVNGPTVTGSTLCTWTYADARVVTQLAWYDTIVNDPNTYSVTLPDGQTVTGSFTVSTPWTLTIVNIET